MESCEQKENVPPLGAGRPDIASKKSPAASGKDFVRRTSGAMQVLGASQRSESQREETEGFRTGLLEPGGLRAEPGVPIRKEELPPEMLKQMLANCLKLASENKITQKNTWELKLIDHASDLVLADPENDGTNFQKASCVLETGVKIYATRVDATHSEAYKVLGGLNRTSADEATEDGGEGDGEAGDDEERQGEGRREKKGHSTTLEPTLEALNLKKFDTAFTIDPLFHQTSAQFDEGGAKGLLLNNLSVFRGCEIVFDSGDVPDKSSTLQASSFSDTWVDLSFLQHKVEAMCRGVQTAAHISPTLQEIVRLLNDPARSKAEASQLSADVSGDAFSIPEGGNSAQPPADCGWGFGDPAANLDEDYNSGGGGDDWGGPDDDDEGQVEQTRQEGEEYEAGVSFASDGEEDVVRWLEGGAQEGKSKSWAGADHWRARGRPKASDDPSGNSDKPKRPRNAPFLLDFENLPDLSDPQYAPAEDEREICLAPSALTTDAKTLLPEDLHYQPMWLARLFLRPNVVCVPRRVRVPAGARGPSGAAPAFTTAVDFQDVGDFWDDDDNESGAQASPFVGTNGWANSDGPDEETDGLVEQPRRVEKVDIKYARTSKQVDVKILKETLWTGLQRAPGTEEADADVGSHKDQISFRGLLENIPSDCAAADLPDISVHLCFICVLHLANEHGLAITGSESMDELVIDNVPFA